MSPAAVVQPSTDPARAFVLGDKLGTGSFGVVYKAYVPFLASTPEPQAC